MIALYNQLYISYTQTSSEHFTRMDGRQPSQALTKCNTDSALMPPPPPPKRIKRPAKVLDEDVYTDALSHIIARDFFPGLLETQAQHEYLEALDSKNNDWIRDAGRRLHQAMTPGPGGRSRRGTSMTPAGQTPRHTRQAASATPRGGWVGGTPTSRAASATPSSVEEDDRPAQPPVDTALSLGAFQAKYTSEDNESFNTLLDRQNAKRAAKYAFFHSGNKLPSPRQIAYQAREQKLLGQNPSTATSSTSSSTALTVRPSQDLNTRPNHIETTKSISGPRNTLMFAPDSIEDTHLTIAQHAQDSSLAPPKSVSYTSTRLPGPEISSTGAIIPPPSPSLSAIDAAIAGRPRGGSGTATSPGYTGASTPRVSGYSFVDATPTPAEIAATKKGGVGVPVSDAEADAAEREAASALLPAVEANAGTNPFVLQAASRREELHHRMVDAGNSGRRKGGMMAGGRLLSLKGEAGRTPTPKFASSPVVGRAGAGIGKGKGSLTPAARMLAARIGRTPVVGGDGDVGGVFGAMGKRDGKKAWTPTPRVKRVG